MGEPSDVAMMTRDCTMRIFCQFSIYVLDRFMCVFQKAYVATLECQSKMCIHALFRYFYIKNIK